MEAFAVRNLLIIQLKMHNINTEKVQEKKHTTRASVQPGGS